MDQYSLSILTVFAFLVGSNGVTERRQNSCVIWQDDLLTLTITCRLAYLSQPFTIANQNEGTQVNCSIIKRKPVCYPKEKNTRLNRYNRTVSIELIELKTESPSQGSWQCKQGETSLVTEISLSKGIISDSWVNVRGKITGYKNDNKDIIVDCSSCRIPDNNYVEFLVNNRSYGSMHYDDGIGVCYHNFIKCNSVRCNCSQTGNMFQLRLSLTDDIKEIVCGMIFYDWYRRRTFGITSNLKITENEILYDSSITEVMVKNKYKPTIETQSKTGGDKVNIETSVQKETTVYHHLGHSTNGLPKLTSISGITSIAFYTTSIPDQTSDDDNLSTNSLELKFQNYLIMSVTGLAFLIVFVGCVNVIVSRRIRSLPVSQSSNINNQDTLPDESVDDQQHAGSDYTSINESEMITTTRHDTSTIPNDKQEHISLSSTSSSVKSDPSYLEVIDDPESVNRDLPNFSANDSSDFHVYRVTSFQSETQAVRVVYENEKI